MRVFMCVVAFAAVAGAAQRVTPKHLTSITYGPSTAPTAITADDITYSDTDRTTHARGHVRIASGVATITADEADAHLGPLSRTPRMNVDLRGNVQVLIDTTGAAR